MQGSLGSCPGCAPGVSQCKNHSQAHWATVFVSLRNTHETLQSWCSPLHLECWKNVCYGNWTTFLFIYHSKQVASTAYSIPNFSFPGNVIHIVDELFGCCERWLQRAPGSQTNSNGWKRTTVEQMNQTWHKRPLQTWNSCYRVHYRLNIFVLLPVKLLA